MRLLTRPIGDIEATACRVLPAMQAAVSTVASASCAPCQSQIGSGALPGERLPSVAIVLRPPEKRPGKTLQRLEAALRGLPVPVIGHLRDDALWLDLRCLEAADEARFAAQLDQLPARLDTALAEKKATP